MAAIGPGCATFLLFPFYPTVMRSAFQIAPILFSIRAHEHIPT